MNIADAISEISEVLILERQNYSNDAHLAFELSIEAILGHRPDDAHTLQHTCRDLEAKAMALVDIHGPILSVFSKL